MINGGYRGKILRVNLTTGQLSREELPDEGVLRQYVGNFGLGLWHLRKELPAGVGPLEPGNPLIFFNGPLVGTAVPCPNNCTVTTLNADTGFTAGRAHSHGWFGPYLSMAGLDGVIVTGASKRWVYLWIDDDKAELCDADALVGKDTHETEELIKQALGIPIKVGGGASVAAIGPGGENLVAGALIANDKNHSFSHSGVGAVMGSKKLKAVAVRGTGKVAVADRAKLAPVAREWTTKVTTEGARGVFERFAAGPSGKLGGAVPKSDYAGVKAIVGLSAKNWTVNDLPGFGDRWSKQTITPRPCYGCPLSCGADIEIVEGAYRGHTATLSGGGENLEGAASIVGAGTRDPGEALYLTDLHDRLGFETSTVGCAMAVAFEAYEKGLLTAQETDGLELKWGDVAVIETLLRRIAHREGRFASLLADGPKAAAERVGLPHAAVHIKGSGMNLHDWRRAWGVLLGQIVGGGSGWPGPGADCWAPEPDAGYPQKTDPLTPFGKGEEVANTAILKMWDDCHGTCWFATWGVPGQLEYTSQAIAATVGWEDFTPREAWAVGHRVLTLERIFNMQHGLTVEDDLNVSPRIADPAPPDAGPAAGKSVAPYIEGWVRDYYQALGWDRRTGAPLRSTLQALGLGEFTDSVWG